MIVEVFVFACSIAQPANCQSTKIINFNLDIDSNAYDAVQVYCPHGPTADAVAKQWEDEHPGWKFKKFTCKPAQPDPKVTTDSL
jgi:hypothetical protein